jgi:hypothetical protein
MSGSVIRCLPKEQLHELLLSGGVPPGKINQIDYDLSPRKRVDAVFRALEKTGPKVSDRVYALIDRANQFYNDHGLRSLRSVVIAEDLDLEEFDAIEGVRASAVWLLARSTGAFERALAANYADSHTLGRMWSGFVFDGPVEMPRINEPDARLQFEEEVRDELAKDAQSGRCSFDWFARVATDPVTGEDKRCVQVTIYQETRPQIEPQFTEDGHLGAVTRRPVYEGAIVFDEQSATIDVVAKGGLPLRRQIADMLGKAISFTENKVQAIELRLLNLSRFLGDEPLEIKAEDGITRVWVERLTLESSNAGGLVITLTAGFTERDSRSLNERARDAFGSNSPLSQPDCRVIEVRLRVFFASGKTHSRSKGMPLDLKLQIVPPSEICRNTNV